MPILNLIAGAKVLQDIRKQSLNGYNESKEEMLHNLQDMQLKEHDKDVAKFAYSLKQ